MRKKYADKRTNAQRSEEFKAYYQRLRSALFVALGDKCKVCGFDDRRALQIDHINGDGSVERRATKRSVVKLALESVMRGENKYQILCANHNWIKRYENNEVRKPKKHHG